jgi:hypothetical protein
MECAQYPRFLVEVRKYDEEREISLKQMAYFHAVVVPLFVDYTGDSPQYWENRLKLECGSKWFKPEVIEIEGRHITIVPSKKRLSTKNFSEWYQNIRDFGDSIGVLVPPPDPEWRTNKEKCSG